MRLKVMLFCAFLCIGVMASLAFAQVMPPLPGQQRLDVTQSWNYPKGASVDGTVERQLRLTNPGYTQAGLLLGSLESGNAVWSSDVVPSGANTIFSIARSDYKALDTRSMLPPVVTLSLDWYACKPKGHQMECRIK